MEKRILSTEKPIGSLQTLKSMLAASEKKEKDHIPVSGVKSAVIKWRAGHRLILLLGALLFLTLLFFILLDVTDGPWGFSYWPAFLSRFLLNYPPRHVVGDEYIDFLLFDQNMRFVAFSGNYILFIGLYFLIGYRLVWRYEKNNPLKYHPCLYEDCQDSVGIYVNWQCNRCKQFQGSLRYICDPCIHCKRYLETAFCEHCHREFKI